MFLDGAVEAAAVDGLDATRWGDDEAVGRGTELFLRFANGSHGSKLTLGLLERELGVTGTARNWVTVERLAAMLRAPAG